MAGISALLYKKLAGEFLFSELVHLVKLHKASLNILYEGSK